MSVAATRRNLKQRVDDYLWREPSPPMANLRRLLGEHFSDFERVAVIGGMVRDIARAGRRGFNSDVDIVIGAPCQSVSDLAARLGATANRFGGFSYDGASWKIDFWAIGSTWAVREGHADVCEFEDVTRCTFFDCDAILYDLKTKKIHCDVEYLVRLQRGQIELNLDATPSVSGNLLRAIRRILLWDVDPGPRLAAFIDAHLTDEAFDEIERKDRASYVNPLIRHFGSPERLRGILHSKAERTRVATFYARQLALPGI